MERLVARPYGRSSVRVWPPLLIKEVGFTDLFFLTNRQMYYFYVLYSLKDKKLYKGITSDIAQRFIRHNSGGNKSTAHRKPFALVYIEAFPLKEEALEAERFYKSLEGGTRLKSILFEKGIFDHEGKLN